MASRTQATPRNCFKMLQAGQAVLLYPGGAREVAKRKGEKYKLMWKDDAEFVRLAMRFQCTIVPFASVGTEDAFNIAMDSEEIMKSPAGPAIRRMLDKVRVFVFPALPRLFIQATTTARAQCGFGTEQPSVELPFTLYHLTFPDDACWTRFAFFPLLLHSSRSVVMSESQDWVPTPVGEGPHMSV